MTCIVGLKANHTVWIGGDSATATSYRSHVSLCRKVFERGDFLIGGTTSWRMLQLLQYELTIPVLPRKMTQEELHGWMVKEFVKAVRDCLTAGGFATKDKEQETGGSFLIGVSGRLFGIESDYQVAEYDEGYISCGSGMELALGALHITPNLKPRERLRLALEASAHHNPFVRPPFTIGANTFDPETGDSVVKWE